MKITDLHVDGFGVWSGLALENFSEGLIVFYGPNEAGKTTLLQFMRSVLYGFSPERRSRYLPPLRGGTGGGSIHVRGAEGQYWITRHDDGHSPQGRVRVVSDDGASRGPQVLDSLLGDVDEATFNNVFAIGLRELEQLDTLSSTDAAGRLFRLSAGLDRVSLVEVLSELESSRRRILAPAGEPSQVAELVSRREELLEEIKRLGSQSSRYSQLARRRRQLARDVAAFEQDADALGQRLRIVEVAALTRDAWRERARLDVQLTALGKLRVMPNRALERLDALNERLTHRKNQREHVGKQRKALIREAKTLSVDRDLWRQAPRIEVLVDQQAWIADEEDQLRRIESDVRDIQSRIDHERQSLGLPAGASEADQPALPSVALLPKVRPAARKLRAARRSLEDARREIHGSQETAQALANQIGAALGTGAQTGLTDSLEQAGTLVSRLRRRVQIDERIDQLKRNRRQLEDRASGLIERQMLPAYVLVGLGGLFVLGVVMILAGLFLPESVVGAAGWALAVLGLAGTASAAVIKFLLEQSAVRQLDVCNKQLDLVSLGLKQAREERDALSSQLSTGSGPLLGRLEQAESELAELESLIPIDARRQAAQQQNDHARRHAEEARQELGAARRDWRRALERVGLPESLSPKQVRRLMGGRKQLQEHLTTLGQRRDELASRQRLVDGFGVRVKRVLGELDIRPAGETVADQLRQLHAMISDQRAAVDRRQRLVVRNRRLRRQQRRLAQAVGQLDSQRRELFRQAGLADEEQFRQRALEQARHGLISTRRETLDRDIAAALSGVGSEKDLERLVNKSTDQQLAAERQRVSRRFRTTQKKLAELLEQRGRLAEQEKQLTSDRRLAVRHLELAQIEHQIGDAVGRWQVLATTHRLLKCVRERYERERQPETLGAASGYLHQLTQGRYTRVWTPLGERVLRVDDDQGQTLSVEVLSRGTREQLFLSLRLALASTYAQRGITLPLVMDDLLVNFDANRAKAAATVLRDFAAAGHQLFVFTCHQHIAKLFRSLRVTVRELPDAAELNAPTIAYVPPRKEQSTAEKPRRRRTMIRARRDDAVADAVAQEMPEPSVVMKPPATESGDEIHHVPKPHVPLVRQTTPQTHADESDQEPPHLIWADSGAEAFAGPFSERLVRADAGRVPADESMHDFPVTQEDGRDAVHIETDGQREHLDRQANDQTEHVIAFADENSDLVDHVSEDEEAEDLYDEADEDAGDVDAEVDEANANALDHKDAAVQYVGDEDELAASRPEEDLDYELADEDEEDSEEEDEEDEEALAEDEQQSVESELEEDLDSELDDESEDDIEDEYEEYEDDEDDGDEEQAEDEDEALIDDEPDEVDDDEEDAAAA